MVLEFYDRLLNSMKIGKDYSSSDVYVIAENIIETQLKPAYGELVSEYRIKEQIPFMIGWLSASKLLKEKETSQGGVSFSKSQVSKEKLEEELKDFLERFPRKERKF